MRFSIAVLMGAMISFTVAGAAAQSSSPEDPGKQLLARMISGGPIDAAAAQRELEGMVYAALTPGNDAARAALADTLSLNLPAQNAVPEHDLAAKARLDALRYTIVRWLGWIATEGNIGRLSSFLYDKDISDAAASGLARIGGDMARETLLNGLTLPETHSHLAAIHGLIQMHADGALAAIVQRGREGAQEEYWAAVDALAAFGVPAPSQLPAKQDFSQAEALHYMHAGLRTLFTSEAAGDTVGGAQGFRAVAASGAPLHICRAAVIGLAGCDAPDALRLLMGRLDEPVCRPATIASLIHLPLPSLPEKLTQVYPYVTPAARAAILEVLAARQAPEWDALCTTALADPDPGVRMTAQLALHQTPVEQDVAAALDSSVACFRDGACRWWLTQRRETGGDNTAVYKAFLATTYPAWARREAKRALDLEAGENVAGKEAS